MAAKQNWSKLYDDLPGHPKFVKAGHKAGWLYICGQCYCSRHLTDGKIPKAIIPRLFDVKNSQKSAEDLVRIGLWHDRGDHYEQQLW